MKKLTLLFAIVVSIAFSQNSVFAQSGELYASLYAVPVSAGTGLGTTNIQWTSNGTSFTQVWVKGASGIMQLFAATIATIASSPAPWIEQGGKCTFYLFSATGYATADTVQRMDSLDIFGIAPIQPRVGINKMDLLEQYYGNGSSCNGAFSPVTQNPCTAVAKRMGKKAILDAKYMGAGYIRVDVSDYRMAFWHTDSVNFWNAMDEMINDLTASDIKLVPSLLFNTYQYPQFTGTDFHTFVTDSNSLASQYAESFIKMFINRYKNNPTIYFYELTNEMNISADIDTYSMTGNDSLYANYTTDEMNGFNKRFTKLIRSLDPTRLITSGYGFPRTCGCHLWQIPEWESGTNWTSDTRAEYIQDLMYIHKYFDIVSVHPYNGSNDNQRFGFTGIYNAGMVDFTKQITDSCNKLLYIGEFGDQVPVSFDSIWPYSQNVLSYIQSDSIPFSSPWILEFYPGDTYNALPRIIDPVYTAPLINKIMTVNLALGNSPVAPVVPDTIKPQCIIAFPFAGNTFNIPYDTVYPIVSDNSLSINRVELWLNGVYHSTSTTWPYKLPLRTDTLPNCDPLVMVRTYDNSGNYKDDSIVIHKTGTPCGGTSLNNIAGNSGDITVYPTPATDILIIETLQKATIEITNIQGQLIKTIATTGNKTNIDVSAFPSGLYLIKVKTENNISVKKFIKE